MPSNFRKVRSHLRRHDVVWHKDKGKGSHGVFTGTDFDGNRATFPVPRSQHREIDDIYLKRIAVKFGIPLSELKD